MPQLEYQDSREQGETDVKWLEDSAGILEELEHDFRGEELIETKSGYFWKRTGEPIMNDKGIRSVLSSIRHITNKNTFMSNVTSKRVSDLCFDTQSTITTELFYKYQEFGIAPEYFTKVVIMISNVIELALRRAEGAGDRRAITGMSQNITKQEIRQVSEEPAKKEGLTRFKNF